jgi:hypothetical protein
MAQPKLKKGEVEQTSNTHKKEEKIDKKIMNKAREQLI